MIFLPTHFSTLVSISSSPCVVTLSTLFSRLFIKIPNLSSARRRRRTKMRLETSFEWLWERGEGNFFRLEGNCEVEIKPRKCWLDKAGDVVELRKSSWLLVTLSILPDFSDQQPVKPDLDSIRAASKVKLFWDEPNWIVHVDRTFTKTFSQLHSNQLPLQLSSLKNFQAQPRSLAINFLSTNG